MQHCSDRGLLRADAASKTFPHASLKIGRVLLQNFADSWGLPLATERPEETVAFCCIVLAWGWLLSYLCKDAFLFVAPEGPKSTGL